MKIVDDKLFDSILEKSGPDTYFYKPEDGRIEVILKSGVRAINPGDTDSNGRIWNPKLVDANGNPKLDRQGNPMQPWTKYEALAIIKGVPNVFSFGGEKSPMLRAFIKVLKAEELSNGTLPGTKWSFEKIGQWDWAIKYLGKVEGDTPSSKPSVKKEVNPDLIKIKEALASKKDMGSNGIAKADIIAFLSFVTHKKADDVKALIPSLVSEKIIKEENNLIYIL
jgi:hypothetical protein